MKLKHGLIETRCGKCGVLIGRAAPAVETMRQARDGVPEIAETTKESRAEGLCAACWREKEALKQDIRP